MLRRYCPSSYERSATLSHGRHCGGARRLRSLDEPECRRRRRRMTLVDRRRTRRSPLAGRRRRPTRRRSDDRHPASARRRRGAGRWRRRFVGRVGRAELQRDVGGRVASLLQRRAAPRRDGARCRCGGDGGRLQRLLLLAVVARRRHLYRDYFGFYPRCFDAVVWAAGRASGLL